jgi:ABC-type amino acid transport system permease subunit
LARAYLQAAQASFQLGTYTGLVQATFAADLAMRIATRKISPAIPRTRPVTIGEVINTVTRATRRLWRKLPLLAILLGWFIAGIVAGIASLALPSGAALRAWLLSAWAMGLLVIVLVGFVRSIRRLSRGSR